MNFNIETSIVEYSKGFGFIHWTLVAGDKRFLLGQDVKWVMRVVGIDYNDLMEMFEIDDDRTEESKKKIGTWIGKTFKLTPKKVEKLNEWDLCCQ
jgi:hypothetical protein